MPRWHERRGSEAPRRKPPRRRQSRQARRGSDRRPASRRPQRRRRRRSRRALASPDRGQLEITASLVRPGRPPLLRWTPVRGARYYNLQLWRRGRKILSVWPARPKGRWKVGGGSWRLEPGRYRWFVWPGFGPRSKADYGRRLGPGRFRWGPVGPADRARPLCGPLAAARLRHVERGAQGRSTDSVSPPQG
jgi:hypothetical protein